MLWTICIILLVLWALGMATSYTAGGLIHILLVIGLIVLVFRLIQGRLGADQREAQGRCVSCGLGSLHAAQQLALGTLHGQRGFGVGL
jgi:uncharacterized protein (DUF58 family)